MTRAASTEGTMKDAKIEVVVRADVEGFSLTLFRQATQRGDFEYFTELEEMGFEDISGQHKKTGRVSTLEEGFALLDAARGCQWHRLHAIEVHSDHAADVLAAVEARLSCENTSEWNEDVLAQWRHRCDRATVGRS